MKKIIMIIISLVLMLMLVACDNSNKNQDSSTNKTIESSGDTDTVKLLKTAVAYANWAENFGGLVSDENCLDADKFIYSDLPRLPLFKFDNKIQLDDFVNKYKDIFTMDHGMGDIPSFNDAIQDYDDEFFNEHSLMLAYQEASSGSFRYGITEVKKENGTLVLRVEKLNNPEVYTDDMSGWFLMAEVEKEYIKDCTSFDAQLWGNYSGNITTYESNKITIKNGINDYDSINVGRIESFIDNSTNGVDDEIEVTHYTIEGDPIITTVRFNAIDGTFETTKDTTKDKFGKPEVIKKEYDSSYKAKLGGNTIVEDGKSRTYYTFQVVNDEDVVDICAFSY